jgi:hypothetical protein
MTASVARAIAARISRATVGEMPPSPGTWIARDVVRGVGFVGAWVVSDGLGAGAGVAERAACGAATLFGARGAVVVAGADAVVAAGAVLTGAGATAVGRCTGRAVGDGFVAGGAGVEAGAELGVAIGAMT